MAAGSELAHELSSWDWRALTFRAVAERAGVGERTVYRHFPTERQLHDAVMERLNEEAGVDYEALDLASLGPTTARIFRSLRSFAVDPGVPESDDPTFLAVDARRRAALLRAVEHEAPGWTRTQRETAAAALDIIWNLPSYERLVGVWGMSSSRATATIRWALDLVTAAVEDGEPPGR